MFAHLILPNFNANIWRRRFRIPIKVHGVSVLSHLVNNSNIVNALVKGLYEADEIENISKILQPHDRVLDIGCGIGITSIYTAKSEPTTTILGYDANSQVIQLANKHRSLNQISNCSFHHGAVTSEDTPTMEFYIPEQFWAGSTIISENSELTTVPNSNLFTLIKEFNPTVIFIDVEGGEYDLLRKIKWNKLSVRNLVIEFHSHPDAISCISQIWPTLTSYYTSSASSSELQNYLQLSKRVTPITLTLSKKT